MVIRRKPYQRVMIRFRRIFDLETETEKRRFAEAQEIFRRQFPAEREVAERIEDMIHNRSQLDFELILLLAEDARHRVTGLTFTYYFPEIRFAYLQYIASHPDRHSRGIGGALYEALRELLTQKSARGLLLDVPPDEADKLRDRQDISKNRKRMRFYERYGALPVTGTLWDVEANPRNEYYLTMLLYDPLGRSAPLRRVNARKAVERILVTQYGFSQRNAFVRQIVQSFRDDPVRMRVPKKAAPTASAPATTHWILPIKTVVAERHAIHHLREKGYVERPVRVRSVLRGLEGLPIETFKTKHFSEAHIRAVHDPHLVSYLAAVCKRLDEKRLVYPEVFPIRRPDRRPKELEDRAGYFCADTFTPLTHTAYAAARASVDCALSGAERLLDGERLVYALCRPPGHHAERRVFGGFCYLNNAAIAAHFLSAQGRVALLDIDYHHGNGSQDIFYARRDVYTLSIHGHPRSAYPNFSGYADERGEGDGLGFNRNFPLRAGIDDAQYLTVLDNATALIRKFAPQWLVLSLGFDIMRGDPTGAFNVTANGMRTIGQRIARLGYPTLVVQEGGYAIANLRAGARAFFSGLAGAWYDAPSHADRRDLGGGRKG